MSVYVQRIKYQKEIVTKSENPKETRWTLESYFSSNFTFDEKKSV